MENTVQVGRELPLQAAVRSASQTIGDVLRVGLSVTNVFDQQRFHYFGGSIIGRRLMAFLTWEP